MRERATPNPKYLLPGANDTIYPIGPGAVDRQKFNFWLISG